MTLKETKTDKYTTKSGLLDVGHGHKIYFEQWGNPDATPILLFHGGPGDSFKPNHKYSFDPARQQVIGFDQRGCGNSVPYGKLEHNTTQDSLADAAKILDELDVDKAYVFGGSWGSTLALLFSMAYPERVKATIVNGIFTASRAELNYIDKGLFKQFYPEVWERFLDSAPEKHRDDPTAFHYKVLAGKDKDQITSSAKALDELEGPLLKFDWRGYTDIQPDADPDAKPKPYDYAPYQIYAHYLSNHCFLEDGYILKHAHQIHTPLYIVQGRYDMVCPPITAYKLHQAVPHSKLYITLSSHSRDPENRTALKTLVDTVFT